MKTCEAFVRDGSAERCQMPATYAVCADDGGRIDPDSFACVIHKEKYAADIKAIWWRLDERSPIKQ